MQEGFDEAPARLGLVVVQDRKGDVLDVQADREAEQEEQEQRHDEEHPERGRVAGNLAHLLDHDGCNAHPAHFRASSFVSISRMKTSSREGTIRAWPLTGSPASSSAAIAIPISSS